MSLRDRLRKLDARRGGAGADRDAAAAGDDGRGVPRRAPSANQIPTAPARSTSLPATGPSLTPAAKGRIEEVELRAT